MLTIYLEKNHNIFLNSNKYKFCTIINYIKVMLILYLIDARFLIDILITKRIRYRLQVYVSSILNLCAINFFSNEFDFISKESKCDCLFIYAKVILSLYLVNTIVAKTIVIFTIKKVKD